ncbi:MAG: PTS sugar transporter subunit IIA [Alphaproteobacteria bacterium]|nr:PTS sugar transporter subunit IIA [Alphaproteobacteria bacterium]
MQISDVLSEDMVLADYEADNKRQLLEGISSFIAEKNGFDKSFIFEAVLERENLGSTGYGNGVAFPHARIQGLDKIVTAFVRLRKPMEYGSLDSKPVDLLAFMISPENSGDDYLQTLSAFSQALRNENICKLIRRAKSAHEIYVALQG